MNNELVEHNPGDTWSHDKIRECANVFISTGNYTKTSELTGVNRSTIAAWEHRNNEVWVESCTDLQHEKIRELRNKYVMGAEKALDHTLKTLADASPAQSAVISGVFLDKSRLIDNQSTVITSQDTRELAVICQELSRTMRDHGVVSTQHKVNKGKNSDK